MLGFLRVPPVLPVRFLGALGVLASDDSIRIFMVCIPVAPFAATAVMLSLVYSHLWAVAATL